MLPINAVFSKDRLPDDGQLVWYYWPHTHRLYAGTYHKEVEVHDSVLVGNFASKSGWLDNMEILWWIPRLESETKPPPIPAPSFKFGGKDLPLNFYLWDWNHEFLKEIGATLPDGFLPKAGTFGFWIHNSKNKEIYSVRYNQVWIPGEKQTLDIMMGGVHIQIEEHSDLRPYLTIMIDTVVEPFAAMQEARVINSVHKRFIAYLVSLTQN